MRWLGILFMVVLACSAQAAPEDLYSIEIKAFLQGAYAADTPELMHDTLRQKNLIPVRQPFDNDKFNYAGTESISSSHFAGTGLFVTGNNAIVDWVLVELRDPDDPAIVVMRKAALLQRDGDVIDTLHNETLSFTGLTKTNYYVGIQHRNHLGTITQSPVSPGVDGINRIDFSSITTATNQLEDRVLLDEERIAGLRAGYINNDLRIAANGPGNDMTTILATVLGDETNTSISTNFVVHGYLDTDLNMDGQTVFAGPGNDAQMLLGNVLLHPDNTTLAANFTIKGMQYQGASLHNLPVKINPYPSTSGSPSIDRSIIEGKSRIMYMRGDWSGHESIDSIYLKISDSQGYIEPKTVKLTSRNYDINFYARTGISSGTYQSQLMFKACQDIDCNTVYAQISPEILLNLIVQPGNNPPLADICRNDFNNDDVYEETIILGWPPGRASLLGHCSNDENGDTLTHHWTLVSKPETSQAEISTNRVEVDFQPDQAGTYTIEYYVNDGQLNSKVLTILILAINAPPDPLKADFTISEPLKINRIITLDASPSNSPDSENPTYIWELISPAGSLTTLSNTDQVTTSFKPDIVGEYRTKLTIDDGSATNELHKTITVRPENSPPKAVIGEDPNALPPNTKYLYQGDSIMLDAINSSDYDGDVLSFQWNLLSAPEGSTASLSSHSNSSITFTPDALGAYVLQLIVNDGELDSVPLPIDITVQQSIPLLSHTVIDAEFSQSLNRIITIGAKPHKLYIIDPVTRQETSIALPAAPKAVSVGPDGRFAVVGHDYLVSQVDLENAELVATFVTSANTKDIVLAGNNYAYAVPTLPPLDEYPVNRYDRYFYSINLSNGEETRTLAASSPIKLHSGGQYLYQSGFNKYSIADGTARKVNSGASSCGDNTDIWLSEDGLRIFTACSSVYRSSLSDVSANDFVYNGLLSNLTDVGHLSHSSSANLVLAIADGAYGGKALNFYDYDALNFKRSVTFNPLVFNNENYYTRGRYVFVNKEGTEYYVIAEPSTSTQDPPEITQSNALLVYPIDYQQTNTTANHTTTEPVAKSLTTQNITLGQTTILDGSESLGNIQSYQWTLLKSPEGSNAIVGNENSSTINFQPDMTGKYNLSLTVSNEEQDSEPLLITLNVHPALPILDHRVVDAEYSATLDRIISISNDPNRLYIIDPENPQTTSSINLTTPPKAVSVSPDGHFAAVGHNGQITYIDLVNKTILNSYNISVDTADIVLAGNNHAYVAPASGTHVHIRSINLSTGVETPSINGSISSNSQIKLQADGTSIYSLDRYITPTDLHKFDISENTATYLYSSPYHGEYDLCGKLWLAEDGNKVFTRCGHVFHAGEQTNDMRYYNKFPDLEEITDLKQVNAAGKIVVIPDTSEEAQGHFDPDSRTLRIYDDNSLQYQRTIHLHDFVNNHKVHDAYGRFVFVNAAATKIYVITKAGKESGLLKDYGLLTYPIDYQSPEGWDTLISNQQKWQDFLETIRSFDDVNYRIQINCDCSSNITRPADLTERNNRIYAGRYVDDGSAIYSPEYYFLSISQRFESLFEAYTKADRIEVSYDPQYGYPTSVHIDYSELIPGDEVSYTISNLTIHEN